MMMSRPTRIHLIRYLGVFCAIVMGFVTLVGTSGDDVKDALDIDIDENTTIELDPVTVHENINSLVEAAVGDSNCDVTSIDQALDSVDLDGVDIDDVDIDSIQLNGISGTYTATWTPGTVTSFTCSLTITGSQDTITIAETAINGASGNLNGLLTAGQIDVINYYLSNTSETFTYCVTCDDSALSTFSVEYDIELDVNISGSI
jgi:hypothetical protein